MKIDLHNHTKLCNHATGEMEEFVIKAIEKKIDYFGFSDHAPMNFDEKYRMKLKDMKTYEKEVDSLKNKYKNKITILKGYEVDFLPNFMEQDVLEADVDYLIGSIHFLDDWGFDNPEFIGKYQEVDINEIWIKYFNQTIKMCESRLFQIVGHLDLMKIFKFLPTKNLDKIYKNTLQAIKENSMAIEINSAGFRKKINEQYPSEYILQMAKKFDIPITFGSDAHKLEDIGDVFLQGYDVARKIGFKKAAIFEKKKMSLIDI